jgi:hypothetical protein
MIHLYCHGFEGEDLIDFTLNLTNPSSTAQQQKLQLISTKFEIAGKAPEGIVDRKWIRKNIIGLTNEELESIKEGRKADKLEDAELENVKAPEAAGGAAGGGEAGGAPAGGEEAGGEEAGGLFSGEVKPGDLLTALPSKGGEEKDTLTDEEDDFDSIQLSIDDEDAPIKAQKKMMNAFGGPIKPSRKVSDGPGSTHMPDFAKMTSTGDFARPQDTSNDPFDTNFLFSFKEDKRVEPQVPARITKDFERMVGSLGKAINRKKRTILSEDFSSTFEEDDNGEA